MTAEIKDQVVTSEQWRDMWLGHRKVTRRTIEAFPEDKLYSHSIGGMRPFAELVMETINIIFPGMDGVVTGKWESFGTDKAPQTKAELLQLFDKATAHIEKMWSKIPLSRFQEIDKAFGMYDAPIYWHIFYFIDNEIHHRGQGYVYLRSLGIGPPPFWER